MLSQFKLQRWLYNFYFDVENHDKKMQAVFVITSPLLQQISNGKSRQEEFHQAISQEKNSAVDEEQIHPYRFSISCLDVFLR